MHSPFGSRLGSIAVARITHPTLGQSSLPACRGYDLRMRRITAMLPAIALIAAAGFALAGCTDASTPTPSPTSNGGGLLPSADASADPSTDQGAGLPECDVVEGAAGSLVDGLAFSERLSAVELPAEAYAQRLCVFSNADDSAQIGITIATVALLPTEIELYASMPTSVADDRLVAGQVLQRHSTTDDPAGALTGAESLFDATVTVTVQGFTTGAPMPEALPGLTVTAATDALFAVRAILP